MFVWFIQPFCPPIPTRKCVSLVKFFFQTLLFLYSLFLSPPYHPPLKCHHLPFYSSLLRLSFLWVSIPFSNSQIVITPLHHAIVVYPSVYHLPFQFLSCWQQPAVSSFWSSSSSSLNSLMFHFSPLHRLSFILPSIHPSCATFPTLPACPLLLGFKSSTLALIESCVCRKGVWHPSSVIHHFWCLFICVSTCV